ncbi:nucleotide-binding protein, partial [Thermodesulfatator atlanticus]
MKLKAFVTGAPASGSGKTTLTLALARAFCDKGLAVAPFKVGPDYIDPGFLAKAARRPCYNLDLWMCGKDGLRRSFSRGACFANIAVIEGAMGLFDGPLGKTPSSTAEVAKALKIPVLLVLSAKGAAQTLAAL